MNTSECADLALIWGQGPKVTTRMTRAKRRVRPRKRPRFLLRVMIEVNEMMRRKFRTLGQSRERG